MPLLHSTCGLHQYPHVLIILEPVIQVVIIKVSQIVQGNDMLFLSLNFPRLRVQDVNELFVLCYKHTCNGQVGTIFCRNFEENAGCFVCGLLVRQFTVFGAVF